jgi:hypothetical protein
MLWSAKLRQVLECASPLAPWIRTRATQKRQSTAAVQDSSAAKYAAPSTLLKKRGLERYLRRRNDANDRKKRGNVRPT